jgi:DNA topoisomerase IA
VPGDEPGFERAVMADQIVITEKSSQAKDVRAAVGSRYGDILPAEGHLFDLLEPEDVVPAWKRWSISRPGRSTRSGTSGRRSPKRNPLGRKRVIITLTEESGSASADRPLGHGRRGGRAQSREQ